MTTHNAHTVHAADRARQAGTRPRIIDAAPQITAGAKATGNPGAAAAPSDAVEGPAPRAVSRLFRALEAAEIALLKVRQAAEEIDDVDVWYAVESAGADIQAARRRMLARTE